jgi:hypothetical protein
LDDIDNNIPIFSFPEPTAHHVINIDKIHGGRSDDFVHSFDTIHREKERKAKNGKWSIIETIHQGDYDEHDVDYSDIAISDDDRNVMVVDNQDIMDNIDQDDRNDDENDDKYTFFGPRPPDEEYPVEDYTCIHQPQALSYV